MKGFMAVTLMSFRTWYRDRSSVFWGVLFPILFMGLIGSVFGGDSGGLTFEVSVVPSDQSAINEQIIDALAQVPSFRIVEESLDDALARLEAGERSMVVVLPDVSESHPTGELIVYYDEGRSQVNQAGIAIVRQVVDEINKAMTGRRDILSVEARGMRAQPLTMFDFLLPGVMAMTLMQTGLMGVTYVVANYRESMVIKRVLTTGFHPFAFLSGLIARFTIVNLMQAVLIFLAGTLIYGAKVTGSIANLAVLAIIGSITFLAIGFFISTISKSAESANALGSLVSFPMLFLSGTFWPREMLPDVMQPIVGALPLTPLVDAMRGVSTSAHALSQHTTGILYMVAWAIVCFALSTWRFRWE